MQISGTVKVQDNCFHLGCVHIVNAHSGKVNLCILSTVMVVVQLKDYLQIRLDTFRG